MPPTKSNGTSATRIYTFDNVGCCIVTNAVARISKVRSQPQGL